MDRQSEKQVAHYCNPLTHQPIIANQPAAQGRRNRLLAVRPSHAKLSSILESGCEDSKRSAVGRQSIVAYYEPDAQLEVALISLHAMQQQLIAELCSIVRCLFAPHFWLRIADDY